MDENSTNFAILQDSKNRLTFIRSNESQGWIKCDADEFEIMALLAQLIRCGKWSANQILNEIQIATDKHSNKKDNDVNEN